MPAQRRPRGQVPGSPSRLDPDERDVVAFTDTAGRPNRVLIISEPGLYNLSKRSTKPGPKRFWRWITHEVLPSLRKTGGYGNGGGGGKRDVAARG